MPYVMSGTACPKCGHAAPHTICISLDVAGRMLPSGNISIRGKKSYTLSVHDCVGDCTTVECRNCGHADELGAWMSETELNEEEADDGN